MSSRKCGTCNECCIQPRIAELHKSAQERCPNLSGKLCSIYEDRPGQCREFSCVWLDGNLPKSARPDKTKTLAWLGSVNGQDTLCVMTRPGAKLHQTTFKTLLQYSHNVPLHITTDDRTTRYRNGARLV